MPCPVLFLGSWVDRSWVAVGVVETDAAADLSVRAELAVLAADGQREDAGLHGIGHLLDREREPGVVAGAPEAAVDVLELLQIDPREMAGRVFDAAQQGLAALRAEPLGVPGGVADPE